MAAPKTDVSGVAVGVIAAGVLVLWSGIRGASVVASLQEILKGQKPSGETANPISGSPTTAGAGGLAAGAGASATGAGSSNDVVRMAKTVAATPAGKRNYCWGGGHTSTPCSARCFDCSGYVSCVLGRLGKMRGSMVTTGFMVWGGAKTVSFADRRPGDLYVSATHIGIIADDINQMWNAACTACGPVKLSSIKGGRRGYITRRVK